MKKYYLFIMLIVAVALASQQNLAAQEIDPQHPLYPFFYGDARSEIEKISNDPLKMRDYVASQKDINARYKYGRTLLHYAAIKNYKDIVRLLLDKGADINALDETKNTPLHDAVSYKAMDVIGFLLERGADMNLKNDGGQTALHNAMLWFDKKSAIQCVQLFMERGFDVKKSADAKLLYEAIAREHKGYGDVLWSRLAEPAKRFLQTPILISKRIPAGNLFMADAAESCLLPIWTPVEEFVRSRETMFMMKKNLALFLISFVLVFACAQPVCAEEREWLILVCVSGNNDRGLTGSVNELVNSLEKVGSSEKVTVIVHASLEKSKDTVFSCE